MVEKRKPIRFQWDKGNKEKSWKKHRVSQKEAEEVFFDKKKVIYRKELNVKREVRQIVIGKTLEKRLLFVVFTTRNEKIRVISARDVKRSMRYIYDKNRRKGEKTT